MKAPDENKEAKERAKEEREELAGQIDLLDNFVNSEDWRELLGYKKLNRGQLKALALYIQAHPQFKDANTEQLAELALQLFPEIRKKGRPQRGASSRAAPPQPQTATGGIMLLLLVLVAGLIAWWWLTHASPH